MKITKFATALAMGAMMAGTFTAMAEGDAAPKVEAKSIVATKDGVPGGARIETLKITAVVTALDAEKRLFTIKLADDETRTYKAGPEVVNYPQIKVGDKVVLTLAEAIVVSMTKNADAAPNSSAAMGLAPVGAKPAIAMANTVEVTAKVQKLDLEGRKATLEFPDGTTKVVKVRPDVDMTSAKVGDGVKIRMTEAMAIHVEKP